MTEATKQKVVIATPTVKRPFDQYLQALEDSIPALDAAGIDHYTVYEIGCPYISAARAKLLRKALDAKADIVVFIDHDVSWRPEDLVKLIQTEGDAVWGTYRFKLPGEEQYMGTIVLHDDGPLQGKPVEREDGCVKAFFMPAGFLKITSMGVHRFMLQYPELTYGYRYNPTTDLFNHGVLDGVWYGEDYAFCKRWREMGGDVWVVPDLSLTHHGPDQDYPGNLREFLLKKSYGRKSDNPVPPE